MSLDIAVRPTDAKPYEPAAASAREYLRGSLPPVYREPPAGSEGEAFVLRFLEALEKVLDPIVATIDLLPAHFDLRTGPPEVVSLVGEWLGIELDAGLTTRAHRRLVRRSTQVSRMRGTLFGVWLVLDRSFPEKVFEVRDGGAAIVSTDPNDSHPAGERTVTVTCPPGLSADDVAAVRRIVAEVKPAGVVLELLTSEGTPV